MDHRVSKDMISSGMIPSGEKKKEDLGRTQYGSAPSPSSLADAYKSMYEKKEEVINEMSGMGMTPKKTPAPAPVKKEVPPAPAVKKETPRMVAYAAKAERAKTFDSMKSEISDKDAKRERLKKIMTDNESVDLLAAYRSVYEHHKKDADGNTIPHEGEEINEILGIGAALAKVGAIAGKGAAIAGKGSAVAGKTAAGTAKITTSGGAIHSGASKGTGTLAKAGKVLDKAADLSFKTQMVGGMIPKPSGVEKKKSTAGMVSADADLFDIVKGQLLDEGLTEEEIKDIMLTLTPDEIMEELSDVVKRNDAINKANAMKAAQEKREKSTPPKEVTDAAKRQYKAGSPGAEPYTTADKKTIINYNKNK